MFRESTTLAYLGNLHRWPVERSTRRFRAYVVEPERYEPSRHSAIFDAVVTYLIAPPEPLIDDIARLRNAATVEGFDLVTFPEAFLPAADMIKALNVLPQAGATGCIHAGLRPDGLHDRHLFRTEELFELVERLGGVVDVVHEDSDAFRRWLGAQAPTSSFNVGCLFLVDAHRRLRVCLHPKLVRSKFERSAFAEHDMAEGKLLSVVALVPTDQSWRPVTLQPLLCSDALQLDRDDGAPGPLAAVHRFAACLGPFAPDHIDVVSVATCTPQTGTTERSWHEEFKHGFLEAARNDAMARHHFAAIVLANYRSVPIDQPGGLSGVFLPVPLARDKRPDFVQTTVWGRQSGPASDNRWSRPGETDSETDDWSSRGHIASFAPRRFYEGSEVSVFGFTIDRLPRDVAPIRASPRCVCNCKLLIGRSGDGILRLSET